MENRIVRHARSAGEALGCIDRAIIHGRMQDLDYAEGVDSWLFRSEFLKKDFPQFCKRWIGRIREAAAAAAEKAGQELIQVGAAIRKEDLVREIVERNGINEGLAAVLTATESISTYRLVYGDRVAPIRLKKELRRGLVVYYYFVHRQLGLMHARIQCWLPFPIQIHVNGHSWLARQMQKAGIDFDQRDNCFASIAKPARAQRLADKFPRLDWRALLDPIAKRINPLLKDVLADPGQYAWFLNQCEYATDIPFSDPAELEDVARAAMDRGMRCFSSEDTMQFLGRRLNGNFKGEIVSSHGKRHVGVRLRHSVDSNHIKLYAKNGCVLRVETVINKPYDFRVNRPCLRKGKTTMRRAPLIKGIDCFPQFAEVGKDCNQRYIDAMAEVEPPGPAHEALAHLKTKLAPGTRNARALNMADAADINLFRAVLDGSHVLHGFRNSDICSRLFAPTDDAALIVQQRRRLSRLLALLRNRELITRIPNTRRWQPTQKGLRTMSAAIRCYEKDFPAAFAAAA